MALHADQDHGDGDTDKRLQSQLLHRGHTHAAPARHLDVIVGEADGAKGEGRAHHQPDEGIGEIAPQQCRHQNGDTDEHSAHGRGAGFLLVRFRTLIPDVLADLELAQFFDYIWPDEQGDQHRRQTGKSGTKRQIPEDTEGSEVGEQFLIKEPVEQTSSGILL